MARKASNGVTKSSIIREALAKFPDMGPTEMSKNLTVANPGKKFSPAEVSALKTKFKAEHGTGGGTSTKPEAARTAKVIGNSLVGYVVSLKKVIDGLGGKEEVKRLVDAL